MLDVFTVRRNADGAEIFANGGEALALAVDDLDLGVGLDLYRLPVARELQRAVGERAHEGVVGHDIAQLQPAPAAVMKNQRVSGEARDLPIVGDGRRRNRAQRCAREKLYRQGHGTIRNGQYKPSTCSLRVSNALTGAEKAFTATCLTQRNCNTTCHLERSRDLSYMPFTRLSFFANSIGKIGRRQELAMQEMITANRLADGCVVFLDADGRMVGGLPPRRDPVRPGAEGGGAGAGAGLGGRPTSLSTLTPLCLRCGRAIWRPRRSESGSGPAARPCGPTSASRRRAMRRPSPSAAEG